MLAAGMTIGGQPNRKARDATLGDKPNRKSGPVVRPL